MNLNIKISLTISALFFCAHALAQDTSSKIDLVLIEGDASNGFGISRLKQVEGTSLHAGKKSEVIIMDDVNGNTATNNTRQIYAKIAGLNIWESDGAGLQLGIGGRGLNPNRVSNFNTRQNGYDISADALGYPESYYTPPTEALERIEVLRGAASLQYGTQFGGFINFKLKQGPIDKKIQLTARQTLGSFGFYNAFTSIGGQYKKLNYYSFYQYKQGDGWRPNSGFNVHTAYSGFQYQANKKLLLKFEYTFMDYLAQQPGGLTDKQFAEDPRQSNRERNWFRVNWNLGALVLNYSINERTRINWRSFGLYAQRDALGNLGRIDRPDAPTERNYLLDQFRNFGSEFRFLKHYRFPPKSASTFLIGARYYHGTTYRKQGLGSNGRDADFRFLHPEKLEHSDYTFPSSNFSLFTENIIRFTRRFNVTPGVRLEWIDTRSRGYYHEESRDLAGNLLWERNVQDDRNNTRTFLLSGIGLGYILNRTMDLYANISQNYRSINFNDMRIVNPNSRVDPNLKDEKGYSADIGLRDNLHKILNFDLSLFYMKYNDRIGSIQKVDDSSFLIYRYRTNVSDSRNLGLESFAELDLYKLIYGRTSKKGLSMFLNYSLIDARYVNSSESAVRSGNKVEYVASHILRTGVSASWNTFKLSYQYSYTSEQFTDATNAEFSATAVDGLIPAYAVMDLSLSYSYKRWSMSASANNLANTMYFTRRADGYPGPGIIPSDAKSYFVTLQVKI